MFTIRVSKIHLFIAVFSVFLILLALYIYNTTSSTPTPTIAEETAPTSTISEETAPTPTISGETPPPSPTPSPKATSKATSPSTNESSEATTETEPLSPAPINTPVPPVELHGVWMSAENITTPERIQETLERVVAGGFNAIFVNVFAWGESYYNSALLQKTTAVEDPDFDPLAHLIEEAHRRNLEVHTWYIVGPAGPYGGGPGPIFSQHPEWGAVGIDGSQSTYWFNFTRPDVRNFIGDVMLEMVNNYNIQGIHFDYIRYPNRNLGFDDYSAQAFKEASGLDLETLRYPTLPAFGFFRGNPLGEPATAETLAYFENGIPAVLLNTYGQGQVILLNWDAARRDVMASTEILKRSLTFLRSNDQTAIYLMESETNKNTFGGNDFRKVRAWLDDIGHSFEIIEETDIGNLTAGSVLVMPNVYVITPEVAASLALYVEQGGNIIFVDGPVYAIEDENIQAITGMSGLEDAFEEESLLLAVEEHPLIPNNPDASQNFEEYEALDDMWQKFRKEGINRLVAEVYRRVKDNDPNVQISAAVYPGKHAAGRVLQDWHNWVQNENIDFVIPMAYSANISYFTLNVAEWKSEVPGGFDRVIPGLAVADFDQSDEPLKPVDNILNEISIVKLGGARGVVLFSIDYIDDEILNSLRQGPFSD